MAKWDKDPLDKMSDAVFRTPKCDYCSYRPKNFSDYVKHLAEKHPENGSTDSGRVSVEMVAAIMVALGVAMLVASLTLLGL